MRDTVRKVLKTGYGLGLLSLDQARKIASSVRKDLKLDEKESRELAKELVETSGKVSKDVLKTTGKYLERAVLRSRVASRSEVKTVKNIIRRNVQRVAPKKEGFLGRVKRKVTGRR